MSSSSSKILVPVNLAMKFSHSWSGFVNGFCSFTERTAAKRILLICSLLMYSSEMVSSPGGGDARRGEVFLTRGLRNVAPWGEEPAVAWPEGICGGASR